jgi:uncharacterized protein (TIGR02453 family)
MTSPAPTFLDEEFYPPFEGFPQEGVRFLKQLKRNNNREWFTRNKQRFEEDVKLPMFSLIAAMKGPLAAIMPEIEVHPKKNIFRIYRDTRFSKDKLPYKTHVAAVFHLRGHWEESAGFYLHIEPEAVYAGGGIYMPDGRQLKKLRRAIATGSEEFIGIVREKSFVKTFGGLEGNKLQRAPLGYPADHAMIEWLKYKQFFAGVEWKVEACFRENFPDAVAKLYAPLVPLLRFLNGALGK